MPEDYAALRGLDVVLEMIQSLLVALEGQLLPPPPPPTLMARLFRFVTGQSVAGQARRAVCGLMRGALERVASGLRASVMADLAANAEAREFRDGGECGRPGEASEEEDATAAEPPRAIEEARSDGARDADAKISAPLDAEAPFGVRFFGWMGGVFGFGASDAGGAVAYAAERGWPQEHPACGDEFSVERAGRVETDPRAVTGLAPVPHPMGRENVGRRAIACLPNGSGRHPPPEMSGVEDGPVGASEEAAAVRWPLPCAIPRSRAETPLPVRRARWPEARGPDIPGAAFLRQGKALMGPSRR